MNEICIKILHVLPNLLSLFFIVLQYAKFYICIENYVYLIPQFTRPHKTSAIF